MSIDREALRRKAKKQYKELVKNVPKRNRMPFAEFFKQYKAKMLEKKQLGDIEKQSDEDFNFEDLINVNEINDEDIETEE